MRLPRHHHARRLKTNSLPRALDSSMSSSNTTRSSPPGSSSLDTSVETGPPIPKLAPPIEPYSRPVSRKGPKARTAGERPAWSSVLNSDGTPESLRDGPSRTSMNGTSPQSRKPKSGGLRNTFRRLFGRKSPKDRISLPAPVGYPRHVSS